jgi:nitric oxide reductase large subunit
VFGAVQSFVVLVISLVVFAALVVALADAARRPARAYEVEGKLTKQKWLLILGFAGVIGLLGLLGLLGVFINLIAVAPALIYWVDVRPRILPYGSGGPRRPQGPQGGW